MAVYDFRDLVCWQLCHALKCEVLDLVGRRPASRDFDYCDQIRRSAASAPANIAEAFGRWRPADCARFLEFACASLRETGNHLVDGRDRGYLDDPLYFRLLNLTRAASRVTAAFLRSKQRQAEQDRNRARREKPPRTVR